MTIMYNSLPLLLIAIVSIVLMFVPTYQKTFAQGIASTQNQLDPTVAVILGGIIGAASSLIGIFITIRYNVKIKKQELEQSLSIELIKHRVDCYALVIKYLEPVSLFSTATRYRDFLELVRNLEKWMEQEKGGLLMSEGSYRKYGSLVAKILDAGESLGVNATERANSNVSRKDVDQVQKAAREFKESLLHDVRVRKEK